MGNIIEFIYTLSMVTALIGCANCNDVASGDEKHEHNAELENGENNS